MDNLEYENFKLKFAYILSYFFDHCDSENSKILAFREVANVTDLNYDDVKALLINLGIIMSEEKYKSIKNTYLRRLELDEIPEIEGDRDSFLIAPNFYESQFPADSNWVGNIKEFRERIDENTMTIALQKFNDLLHQYQYQNRSLIQLHLRNYWSIIENMINEVLMAFFTKIFEREKSKILKMGGIKDRFKREDLLNEFIYNHIKKNMQQIDFVLNEPIKKKLALPVKIERYEISWKKFFFKFRDLLSYWQDAHFQKEAKAVLNRLPKEAREKFERTLKLTILDHMGKMFTDLPATMQGIADKYDRRNEVSQQFLKKLDRYEK